MRAKSLACVEHELGNLLGIIVGGICINSLKSQSGIRNLMNRNLVMCC